MMMTVEIGTAKALLMQDGYEVPEVGDTIRVTETTSSEAYQVYRLTEDYCVIESI